MKYVYKCRRPCLLQIPSKGLNRPYKPGDKPLVINFDLAEHPQGISVASCFVLVEKLEDALTAAAAGSDLAIQEKMLGALTREELFGIAEKKGHKPNDDMKKQDIIDLILGKKNVAAPDAMGEVTEAPAGAKGMESADEGLQEKMLSALTRKELFIKAEEDGFIPTDDMTKKDIVNLLMGRRTEPDETDNKQPPDPGKVETLEAPEGTPDV